MTKASNLNKDTFVKQIKENILKADKLLWYKQEETSQRVKQHTLIWLKKAIKKDKNIGMQKKVKMLQNVSNPLHK